MNMNRGLAVLIYVCSGMLAAVSQLLLKISAQKQKKKNYLIDLRVIVSYGILFTTIFMNMIAMRYMPYKYVPVLAPVSYIFVLLLSYFILKENINKKQIIGTILIFFGIVIFNIC